MRVKRFSLLTVAAMVVVLSLVAASCGDDEGTVDSDAGVSSEEDGPDDDGAADSDAADTAPTKGTDIVIYMQMGGNEGDPSTLARTNGAKAAADTLGVTLVEQYSGWDPQVMIEQFTQARAASPDGIVIMGHPGEDAFETLVDEAVADGIVVTSGNNPLSSLQAKYQTQGFGYAGADLYQGGYLTGTAMVAAGLEPGDRALVYDIWHQEGRSVSARGVFDALEDAGLEVEMLDVSDEVDGEASLAIPILTAYLEANPGLKAIGTQHGNITATLTHVLEAVGKEPGDVIIGGIDLSPATIDGLEKGYISASFDQVLYLQGFLPVLQVYLTRELLIPGLTVNTGVGTFTPENYLEIVPLIDAGLR